MARWLKHGMDASAIKAADAKVRETVEGILADVEDTRRRCDARAVGEVRQMVAEGFPPDCPPRSRRPCRKVVSATSTTSSSPRRRCRNFAQNQRDSMQRHRGRDAARRRARPQATSPSKSVGCYVPGGKYPLLASAHMSSSPPRSPACSASSPARRRSRAGRIRRSSRRCTSPAPTRSTCSAACRRSAPWRSAPRRIEPVDMLVGPGNAYVAEAKRQLFGRVGIDLFAGPTETLVIADDTVDGEICATDLLGPGRARPDLAGHPAHQFREARARHDERGRAPARDPADRRRSPAQAWRDYGEVIVCDNDDEMVREADRIASEHVQVMTRDRDYFLEQHEQLRRAVPRAAHQRRLRRQGDRHQPHAADPEGGALHRRAVGRQVPEDLHLPARADRRGSRR